MAATDKCRAAVARRNWRGEVFEIIHCVARHRPGDEWHHGASRQTSIREFFRWRIEPAEDIPDPPPADVPTSMVPRQAQPSALKDELAN